MKLAPNDLLLFARVVDEGSFSRAADRLGMPKSSLSRRLAALEVQLGERLLLRTTRKLTVTDFGRSVLVHAHQITAEVDAALALTQHRQAEPSGRLRVSMAADFALDVLEPVMAEFIVRHPAITLELDLSPRRVDLIGENFDLAIRMGDLSDDATLAARRLAVMSSSLYAAPTYLARKGMPPEPQALMEHDALRLLQRTGEPVAWILERDGVQWEGTPPGRATANSPSLLTRLALSGVGITMQSDHGAEPYLRSGELVRVLPEWRLPHIAVWAVFPGRRLMPARTRVFLDALQSHFEGPRCQAVEAQVAQRRAQGTGQSLASLKHS